MGGTIARASLIIVGSMAAAILALAVSTQVTSADCAAIGIGPATARLARGTTFMGTVRSYDRLRRSTKRVTWSVERVLAGGRLPASVTYRTAPCVGPWVREGARYLFSTGDIRSPSAANSLAWVIGPGGGVSLWTFGLPSTLFGRDLLAIRSIDDALVAVAPGAGRGLPPTDVLPAGSGPELQAPWPLMGVFAITAIVMALATRRRHWLGT
jgi:hypothetical protein